MKGNGLGGIGFYTLINKILIIDDEVIVCNAIKSHYILKGYYVEGCSSYQEFQDNVILEKFDLILLDLNLKDIKGLELLKIIREIHPDIKIIVVSSYLDHINISKARELGAFKCISKNSQLFQALDQIFEAI